jgi:hypothetical protein
MTVSCIQPAFHVDHNDLMSLRSFPTLSCFLFWDSCAYTYTFTCTLTFASILNGDEQAEDHDVDGICTYYTGLQGMYSVYNTTHVLRHVIYTLTRLEGRSTNISPSSSVSTLTVC